MPTGKQVQGKPLISLTDGKKLGDIKDLLLDETISKLSGVYLSAEGLIKRKELAIPRESVQVMGVDAWLVTDSNVVAAPEDIPGYANFVALNTLRGREIHSEGGTRLAAIEDIIFDDDGDIVGFSLGKIFVQGTLAERKTIAREAISTVGGISSAMTTDLAKAEGTQMPVS